MCATRKEGVPDVECRVGNGSDNGDGGVWNEIVRRKSRPRSAHYRGGAPAEMQYGVLNEISKHQSRMISADGDWRVPITAEVNHGGGGGYEAAHHV